MVNFPSIFSTTPRPRTGPAPCPSERELFHLKRRCSLIMVAWKLGSLEALQMAVLIYAGDPSLECHPLVNIGSQCVSREVGTVRSLLLVGILSPSWCVAAET